METILIPHAELSYEDNRPIENYKNFDWSKGTKADANLFARATGFKETGMSVNEIALLYDMLEKKGACNIVELGRNYGCSTRLFIQHVIRHGGSLQSWDLKHWDGFIEKMRENGYNFGEFKENHAGTDEITYGPLHVQSGINALRCNVQLKVADSMKTPIVSPKENDDRFVDFLLVDTEHGLEHALGEYMRWRNYLCAGAMVAFHDSTLPGPKRAIEIIKEVEEMASPGAGRLVREYVNERVDGYGVQVLEWKG